MIGPPCTPVVSVASPEGAGDTPEAVQVTKTPEEESLSVTSAV